MRTIPFLSLKPQHDLIREELENGFGKVMDRGSFILNGEVEAFEREYAAYSGVNYCVTVANGLDALYISLKVLGIGQNDEVLVPAFTCAPTWMAISRTGATIVPVEVNERTMNIDVDELEKLLTPRTKAVLPVSLFGRPADLSDVLTMAAKKNIFVVEDNAQGHGAILHGKRTGSFGHVNATSFYPTKNLGALGDGGAMTTDDSDLAERARHYRNYGAAVRFHHEIIGINSRLDELQAAFLRIKLKHLDRWNDERRKYAALYGELLGDVNDVITPIEQEEVHPNWHLFVIRTEKRDQLKIFLQQHGVETDIHYPVPPHLQPAYANLHFLLGTFPLTEKICNSVLSLPLWPGIGEDNVFYVCEKIKEFYERIANKLKAKS